jgi:N-acyl amino acid synthase FeeM
MLTHTAQDTTSNQVARIPAELLDGFRFRVCETEHDATRAIAVRRHVYRESCGYSVPVPDEIDARSWLLLAEETETGRAVGSVRITPRFAGPLELEEYVQLPTRLETPGTIEITRLAILPEYRKTNMLVPAVSFGLFRLTYEFAMQLGAKAEVVCAKPERVMSYVLMGFRPTGRSAAYTKLNGARHELLWHDFRHAELVENEMFRRLYLGEGFPQVSTPHAVPSLGLAVSDATFRLAACA